MNGFGNILNQAGQLLKQLPIPDNPYSAMADKFLDFSNGAINAEITDSNNAVQIASITLLFNDRDESDAALCTKNGFEATGAIAVLKSDTGAEGKALLPTNNLDQTYCFRYQTTPEAELQYAPQPSGNGCDHLAAGTSWAEVPNDYLMLLISAQPTVVSGAPAHIMEQSGGTLSEEQVRAEYQLRLQAADKRAKALRDSAQLCQEFGSSPSMCGAP